MLKIGIYGACGKMGKRIAALALEDKDIEVVSAIETAGHEALGSPLGKILITSDTGKLDVKTDCMIDFTFHEAVRPHLEACACAGSGIVIGTTGLTEDEKKAVEAASRKIPVVFSPNMAPGVNLLFRIVKEASRVLGRDFDIKVDETHHVHKKDSPSGTARMIASVIKDACGRDVPVEAFREGEVIGNHGIIFESPYEKLEIRHDAKTRDVFAAGALLAAKFLAGRKEGLYSMADVLGLT
jgi:4-hydroxy-tetrahydrodipicolinate reductase